MPTRFLSRAEIEQLESFPAEINRDELAEHFRLAAEDMRFVRCQNGPEGQLGIAVQLCALRWLGFVPEDLTDAPAAAVRSLAAMLDVPARALFDYSVRPQTRREHRSLVRAHAGWRTFGEAEQAVMGGWLVGMALEHERPTLLLEELRRELRSRRIERPAISRLERLVAWARERAHDRTYELLAEQLTPEVRAGLDALLAPESSRAGRTPLSWLRSRPTRITAAAVRRELEKRGWVIEQVGADRLDLAVLPPNRLAWLAQIGRRSTSQALSRLDDRRRYPVLACFCAEVLAQATDDAIDVFDKALGAADRAAQRKHDDRRRSQGRETQDTIRRFIELGRLLLQARSDNVDPWRLIDRRIGVERLEQDLARAERIARPTGDTHLDLLIAGGDGSRKMLVELTSALTMRSSAGGDERELLAALRLIGEELAGSTRRWLPGFAPGGFIDNRWRPLIVDSSRGRLDRRPYELCAAFELRTALRSGRVCVPGSRRHQDPASYLLPDERWHALRAEFAHGARQPLDVGDRLQKLADEQARLVKRLQTTADSEAEVQLRDGELVADAASDQDARDGKLGKSVAERLPEISLPDLLIEVDGWTGFTERLTPAGAAASRSADQPCVLYAAILAEATNLGLTGMARASQFTYEQLEWTTDWYLRESTLRDANACLVDYHHQLPLTTAWGSGQLSSSDGQRFATRTRGPEAGALPRYFGHRRRGIQMYSWTSDQYSQYDSRVIAANVRDATHTLDGILDNQTALEIEEHTTDTHGYTEMIFAAYDLLGLRFAPRIRDLDRQRLYHHGTTPNAGESSDLLRHRLHPELITPHWDALLRLAASLKHGWAPASLLLSRLQASGPRNPLARALQEYGRLIKTNFILDWLGDEQLRQRYGRQLNKGENLNGLRRVLFYAYEGQPRHRNPDQQQEQALNLTLVVNAIVVWNTVYAQLAIDQLRAEGQLITSSELETISPLQHAHVHAYGEYPIDLGSRPVGYRPLRQPPQRERTDQPAPANRV